MTLKMWVARTSGGNQVVQTVLFCFVLKVCHD
jgi:hypothetical protein